MKTLVFAALAALIAAPAQGGTTPTAGPVTTIVVDTSAQCNTGRISDAIRQRAVRRALKKARELRAQGRNVRVVYGQQDPGRMQREGITTYMPSC